MQNITTNKQRHQRFMFRQVPSFIFILSLTIGQAQPLSESSKDSIKTVLESIKLADQKYRSYLSYRELDPRRVDSINRLPDSLILKHYLKVKTGNYSLSKKSVDSLWQLQRPLDSINKQRFLSIVAVYGFPSFKRVGVSLSGFILHLVGQEDFEKLLPIFQTELAKGNMVPTDFASWYDRCQLMIGNKKLYGEYMSEFPCVDDLEKTNIERKKIGLQELKHNKCQ